MHVSSTVKYFVFMKGIKNFVLKRSRKSHRVAKIFISYLDISLSIGKLTNYDNEN